MLDAPIYTSIYPHSREAEEAVLGSILINPDVLPYVRGIVAHGDFYIQRHGWIFRAICKLADHHEAIDLVTVGIALGDKLPEAGGPAYLTNLANQVPTSLNAESYAREIKEFAIRRNLKAAGEAVGEAALSEGKIEDLVANAVQAVHNAASGLADGNAEDASDLAVRHYEYVTQASEKESDPGIKTGFPELDALLGGGLQNGELILLSSFPGGGKTSIMDQIAGFAAETYYTDLYSLEMNADEQTGRMISQLSGINSQKLHSGKLDEAEWPRYAAAMECFSKLKLRIDDTPMLSATQLRAKAIHRKAQGKLDLIVLDYAGLMSGPGSSMFERYSQLSRDLKLIAREVDVPILAAHQLNRDASQSGKPTMFHLRGSGSWEQDADIVGLLYESDKVPDNKNMVGRTLEIAKHRNGPIGSVELHFHPPSTRFAEARTEALNGKRY